MPKLAVAVLLLAGLHVSQAGEPGEQPMPLPRLLNTPAALSYPDEALRAGLEGKALTAFNLTVDGRVSNAAVIYSDDGLFSRYALQFLSNLRFDVKEPAGQAQPLRYRLGFLFCLPPSSLDDHFAVSVGAPVVVKASRLPHSPIRNYPERGTMGPCLKR